MEYTPGDRMIGTEIDGEYFGIRVIRTHAGLKLTTRGATHIARVLPGHIAPLAEHMVEKIPPDLSKFLICPMPGLITAVHVAAGDRVEAGQPLAIVEAMKMENILRAEKGGVVKAVNAAAGDSLAVDAIILELE
jgi:propionyl-CoA carboxylase alpha chain